MSVKRSIFESDIEKRSKKILSELPEYVALIKELSPLKRPMLLWSVASLVYVWGGLHFQSGKVALWGVQITGITEVELIGFLFLAILYYTLRWAWSSWLRLRPYWMGGFIGELWKPVTQTKMADETREYFNFGEDRYKAKATNDPGDKTIGVIVNDRHLTATLYTLIHTGFSFRIVKFMEHFGAPHIFPLLIAISALTSLLFRFLVAAPG